MKKIKLLITGGTGFVGGNLIKDLKKDREYEILALTEESVEGLGFKFFVGNLMNYEQIKNAFKNIDVVIHLAYSKKYPENIEMLNNLIKACKENSVKKIIFISSMSAKRKNPDEYGKTKNLMEVILKNSGINYTILRPSVIYGKGSTSFNFIIEKINKFPFFTPIIGDGMYTLMPVYIEDVIFVIKRCIKDKITDKKEYDLAGGEEIYFINLVNQIKNEAGIKKKNVKVPIFIAKSVSRIFPGIIKKENVENLIENSTADIFSAKKDLDYNPRTFKEGTKNGIL